MKRLVPFTSVLAALVLLYLGWTVLSRYLANLRLERASKAKQAEAYRGYEDILGKGDSVRILQFYAIPGEVSQGEKALLCYGVANAKTVRIEPELEPLAPSLNRCLEISPAKDTRYALTAEGDDGRLVSTSLVVRVRPR